MRYSILMLAMAGACLVQAQPKGGGAPLDLVADLKANYTAGKTKILAAADEMPEAGYTFQPSPEERNFGAWVAHVADLQAQFCGGITGDTKQLGAAAKTAKADLVTALKASFDMC
ncbi:MAG TPA: DinB family protein, partial [Bryobacteraceae bacterium]